jgi:hypothetical protein
MTAFDPKRSLYLPYWTTVQLDFRGGRSDTCVVAIMGETLYVTIIGPGRCEVVNSGPCDAIEMGV